MLRWQVPPWSHGAGEPGDEGHREGEVVDSVEVSTGLGTAVDNVDESPTQWLVIFGLDFSNPMETRNCCAAIEICTVVPCMTLEVCSNEASLRDVHSLSALANP
mmetsp:Transcript_14375/g.39224  ORF Transcript_14375/g.39224 Transcript_14375/m.39224 type:complete len:104 (+) Transcript_14375:749-1060(+)